MSTENENIKELISAYIDNELSERQQTEIKRLIDHDAELGKYYNRLIKDRALVASLPKESAPESIAKFVISKIEREMILDEYSRGVGESVGKKQLYLRKLVAVAAMIAMIAVLGFVVFEIVAPSTNPAQIMAKNESSSSASKDAPADEVVTYKLNMNTSNMADSTKIMSELVYRNLLESSTVIKKDDNHSEYKIACTGTQAENLIRELSSNWDKFQSPSLVIAKPGNDPISVKNISVQKMLTMLGVDASQGISSASDAISEPVKPRMVSTEDRSIADKEQTQQIILMITISQK
jgi:hypothetical protein